MSEAEVLFENRGNIGLVTLNRPKALNSLTENMCTLIRNQLEDWRLSPAVRAVVVVGSGEKAFCAGGDVVKVTKSYQAGTKDWQGFFYGRMATDIARRSSEREFPRPANGRSYRRPEPVCL